MGGGPRPVDHRGDALVGGCVGGHRNHRQPLVRQRNDVLVEVCLRAAHRDHRGTRPRGNRRDGRADAAAAGTGHHHDASVESPEVRAIPEILHDPLSASLFVRTNHRMLRLRDHYSDRRAPLSRFRCGLGEAIVWTWKFPGPRRLPGPNST